MTSYSDERSRNIGHTKVAVYRMSVKDMCNYDIIGKMAVHLTSVILKRIFYVFDFTACRLMFYGRKYSIVVTNILPA